MPSHRQSRLIAQPAERLFDIVADVERYPDFLPLVRQAKIIQRQENSYQTEQTLMLGLMVQRFRSQTTLERPHRIHVVSNDPPFRRFVVDWTFTTVDATHCRVDFALNCEASSLMLIPFVQMVIVPLAATMVAAFEARALTIGSG